MISSSFLRKWLAIGTGVGVEIGPSALSVSVVRVRPHGARLLGYTRIENYKERPAAEWGAEYAAFLRKAGASHVAATVLLPREEVIVRQVQFPGVKDQDLAAAISFQIDSLHPYPEGEAVYDWARVGSTSTVLIGIARAEVIQRYLALFVEAGIRVAAFSFSASILYSGSRILNTPPPDGFVALLHHREEGSFEVYGESPARPILSATFELPQERAHLLAAAELRLPADLPAQTFRDVLPSPRNANQEEEIDSLAYAAALVSACSHLSLKTNLLPVEQRSTSSRAMYIPTAILAVALVLVAAGLAVQGAWEDSRYLRAIEKEIAALEQKVKRGSAADREVDRIRARARLLDEFRQRTHADLEVLKEATRLLPPPIWLNGLDITRTNVTFAGQAEQAAGLLKVLDSSPLFSNSDFTLGITRVGGMEAFRIRSVREGAKQ
jgi:Tfp pilus assembly protein, ATPase PilM